MANTKHTPGPWRVDRVSGLIDGKSESVGRVWHIADVEGQSCPDREIREEAEANARLIAAAPELLAALDKLAKEIIGCLGIAESEMRACLSNTNVNILSLRVEEAFAAIAKAKGK